MRMNLYSLCRNANVVTIGSIDYLFSYSTCVGKIQNGQVVLTKEWSRYSCTTNKHIYAFLENYSQLQAHSKKEVENLVKMGKILLTNEL